MSIKIDVRARSAYGKVRYYPENENATIFCDLVGVKTLTIDQLKLLKKTGAVISVKVDQNLPKDVSAI